MELAVVTADCLTRDLLNGLFSTFFLSYFMVMESMTLSICWEYLGNSLLKAS